MIELNRFFEKRPTAISLHLICVIVIDGLRSKLRRFPAEKSSWMLEPDRRRTADYFLRVCIRHRTSPPYDRNNCGGKLSQINYLYDPKQLPVPSGSFDVVLCTEVLEHHPEPIAVVHQEPNHYYGGYTPYWYERFLLQAGFGDISIEANAGSLRHYAQESIRFTRMTSPFGLSLPLFLKLAWIPFWLLLSPVLLGVVPLAAKLLDPFDREKRFTVGYHIYAVKQSPTKGPA